MTFLADGAEVDIDVLWRAPAEGGLAVRFGAGESGVTELAAARARMEVVVAGGTAFVLRDGRQIEVRAPDWTRVLAERSGSGDGLVRAPMHGRLLRLAVATGEAVVAGQTVAVVEAMKMEHSLAAPCAGRVIEVGAQEGAQVAQGSPILRIAPEAQSGDGM
jgi:3-methylcrotonyl-CoA carboxylase alpha subunit